MFYGTAKRYRVFVRNFWRRDPETLNLIPDPGARRVTIAKECTEDEAREIAQRYNRTHKPGRLSRKAEYESY